MSNSDNRQSVQDTQLPQARKDDLVVKELADEVLVYDLNRHKAHCLNQTAAQVWNLCDGQTSVQAIAQSLKREMNAPVDDEVVWLALKQLGKANLLEHRIARPEGSINLQRRDVLRRIGIAAAVPLVTSIIAPTASAAGTCASGICVKKSSGCSVCNSSQVGDCFNNSACEGNKHTTQPETCASCFTKGGNSWVSL